MSRLVSRVEGNDEQFGVAFGKGTVDDIAGVAAKTLEYGKKVCRPSNSQACKMKAFIGESAVFFGCDGCAYTNALDRAATAMGYVLGANLDEERVDVSTRSASTAQVEVTGVVNEVVLSTPMPPDEQAPFNYQRAVTASNRTARA